jgi:hypothetical protein
MLVFGDPERFSTFNRIQDLNSLGLGSIQHKCYSVHTTLKKAIMEFHELIDRIDSLAPDTYDAGTLVLRLQRNFRNSNLFLSDSLNHPQPTGYAIKNGFSLYLRNNEVIVTPTTLAGGHEFGASLDPQDHTEIEWQPSRYGIGIGDIRDLSASPPVERPCVIYDLQRTTLWSFSLIGQSYLRMSVLYGSAGTCLQP